MKINAAVDALSALAHDGRVAIFRLLVQAGPDGLTVGRIAKKLDLPGATLSFHLSALKHADLVRAERRGRELIQTANFSCMNDLVSYLTENCCGASTSECAPVCTPISAPRTQTKRKHAL